MEGGRGGGGGERERHKPTSFRIVASIAESYLSNFCPIVPVD